MQKNPQTVMIVARTRWQFNRLTEKSLKIAPKVFLKSDTEATQKFLKKFSIMVLKNISKEEKKNVARVSGPCTLAFRFAIVNR